MLGKFVSFIHVFFFKEWDVKKRLPVQKQFAISAEMLPSYIPTRVANKVPHNAVEVFVLLAADM